MRNFMSWFGNFTGKRTNVEKRRSFQGPDDAKDSGFTTPSSKSHRTSLPPNFTMSQPLSPPPPAPPKPHLYPVPDEIIAATERGMVAENLMCADLPSPILRREPPRTQAFFECQPAVPVENSRVGSVGSRNNSLVQPKHDDESVSPVLTRAEEACAGLDKRSSWGSDKARSVRWKGVDC